MFGGKYYYTSKQLRCIEDNDKLFTKDILSRIENIWNEDPSEWLKEEKKY